MEVTGQDGAVYLCCLLIYYHIALSHMALSQLIKIRDHISPESLGWKAKYILCSIYIRVFKIIVAINLMEIPKHINGLFRSRNYCLHFVLFASSPQHSQTSFQYMNILNYQISLNNCVSPNTLPAANASAPDFKQGMVSYQPEKLSSVLLPDIRP